MQPPPVDDADLVDRDLAVAALEPRIDAEGKTPDRRGQRSNEHRLHLPVGFVRRDD